MKRDYQKPQIRFESFELSQSISAGCELISKHAEYSCAIQIPEWNNETIFADSSCDWSAPDYGDEICYDAPSDSYNVYSS